MHEISMNEASNEFSECWAAAGLHLQAQTHRGNLHWLKANLTPPILEHLSFRLGNQLFFIRVEDIDGNINGPGSRLGLRSIAKGCDGFACRMPMKKRGGQWAPAIAGWGLVLDSSGRPINPLAVLSDEKIEMTDWELHDFAVQIVRDFIVQKLQFELMSSQGNPDVDPSIWFVGQSGGPEWVIVRAVRFPRTSAKIPPDLAEIRRNMSRLSEIGHFASVGLANANEMKSKDGAPTVPLWRGDGMIVRFTGLQDLP